MVSNTEKEHQVYNLIKWENLAPNIAISLLRKDPGIENLTTQNFLYFPKISNSLCFPEQGFFSPFSLFSLCSGDPDHTPHPTPHSPLHFPPSLPT